MRQIVEVFVAGAIAGIFAGSLEAALALATGQGPSTLVGQVDVLAAGGGLVLPFGVLLGLLALGPVLVFPPDRWGSLLRRIESPKIYGIGITLPLLTALLFRLAHHFATAYHNPALASLGWTMAALAAMGLAGLVSSVLVHVSRWAIIRWTILGAPGLAISTVLLLWLGLGIPGYLAGPDRALSGPFGFVGLLRKDTLNWKPVAVLLLLVIVFAFGIVIRRRLSTIVCSLVGVVSLLIAFGGTVCAASSQVRPLILGQTEFARMTLKRYQRLGDRDNDGYAHWLGGGDCDDTNAQRHPGAREVPGNGIDEDCDSEDLVLVPPSVKPPTGKKQRPSLGDNLSFLLLTVDALRWDLGYTGYPRDITPNLDALARKAVVYERAYAISTYTGFSIPPLWASRYPTEMPRTDRHEVLFQPENTLLAERLVNNGFRTGGVAGYFLFKPHLRWIDGFEQFETQVQEGSAPPGSHVDLFHTSRLTADWAIRYLSEVGSQRFFAHAHFTDPHKQYLEHDGFSKYGSSPRDLYDGEVTYVDHHIGRVLQALQKSPAYAHTVVIVSGDHGEAFGEHGVRFHGFDVWDEIVRVPLIISVPGLPPRKLTRPVSHVDIAPTVLDLAGMPPDENARGISLVPELVGDELPSRPVLIDQPRNPYYDAKRAFVLRTEQGTFKLHHLADANSYRLYNLDRDPGEKEDLVETEPDIFLRVRRAYTSYVAAIPEATVTHVK